MFTFDGYNRSASRLWLNTVPYQIWLWPWKFGIHQLADSIASLNFQIKLHSTPFGGKYFPQDLSQNKRKVLSKLFLFTNVLWPQEGATPPSVGSSTLASTWQCEWRFCASYIIRIYPDSPWWHYKLTLLIRSGISITSLRHLDQASSLIFGGRGQNARLNCSKKKKSFEVVNLNAINLYSFSEALLHIAHISQSINSHFRRYLTRLQMAQFVIFFAHAMQPLFIECDYPKVAMVIFMMIMTTKMIMIWQDSSTNFFQIYCWIILGHGVLYFCLFSNFYSKSYLSKKRCAVFLKHLNKFHRVSFECIILLLNKFYQQQIWSSEGEDRREARKESWQNKRS